MSYVGKSFIITYEDGYTFQVTYPTATELVWVELAGPGAGQSGVEQMQVQEVGGSLYFLNWLEASGDGISQILDLRHNRVYAFMTYDTPQGRASLYHQGTIAPAEH